MKSQPHIRRTASVILALALAGPAGVFGGTPVRAQARAMRVGSMTALAAHAEGNLKTGNYLLSGGVSVRTPDGQSLNADSLVLEMGRNPVTKKDDVAVATAQGSVRFRAEETIQQKGAAPQKRVMSGTADRIVWRRFEGKAVLTGHVTASEDGPLRTITYRNAAKATIDLTAGTLSADAATGEQMSLEMVSKEQPAAKKSPQ